MAVFALVLIVALFGSMAAVFAQQARDERRRLAARAWATLERDGSFDTVVARIDHQLPGPTDAVEIARVLQAA
jgi:hypothetical protein